jgi:hypothetical protein
MVKIVIAFYIMEYLPPKTPWIYRVDSMKHFTIVNYFIASAFILEVSKTSIVKILTAFKIKEYLSQTPPRSLG